MTFANAFAIGPDPITARTAEPSERSLSDAL